MTPSPFETAVAQVRPIDPVSRAAADARSATLTKPPGSLGHLETVGSQLAAIAGRCPPPIPDPAAVCVFAADHGVVAEGVTPWPQEVTAHMVANFCAGGAAVNVLARHAGVRVVVTDVGVATEIPGDTTALRHRAVRPGTANLATGPAMSAAEARRALDVGADTAADVVRDGARLLATGEMGIGNTTPAAAVIAAIAGLPAAAVTGRGTGVDDTGLAAKTAVVAAAVRRLPTDATPLEVLAEVGGLEIAAMAGAMIGAAAARVPVVIDGVISASAALIATELAPDTAGYLIAGHRSTEPGSAAALTHLGLQPLLDLGLRLGEGTGAVLAVGLVQAAAKILGEMATFTDAAIAPATEVSTLVL